MSGEHHIKKFSATDIERYHQGLLSPLEMHAMEKAALDDPFLADALEGYSTTGVKAEADLVDLRQRLAGLINKQESITLAPPGRSGFSWWKIAAGVVLIAGAGLLTYQFAFPHKQSEIAQSNPSTNQRTDSTTPTVGSEQQATSESPVTNQDKLESQPGNDSKQVPTNGKEKKTVEPPAGIARKETPALTSDAGSQPGKSAEIVQDKKNVSPSLQEESVNDKRVATIPANNNGQNANLENNNVAREKAVGNATKARSEAYRNMRIFRGRVTDQQNNALPFANITNPVDNVGTYADANGFFTLTSPDSILNVQVRSLGFENNSVALRNNVNENRVLMQDDRSLSARVLDTVKRNTARVRNANMKLEEPEPADGWSNYDTYLVNNLNIPENFKSRQTGGGEVELSFEVNRLGEPINIRVEKSLCETCDKEAIRLVKEGPKWKRASRKNRTKVTVSF